MHLPRARWGAAPDLQLHLADVTQIHTIATESTADLPADDLDELRRYEPGRRRRLAHAGRLLARAALGRALGVPATAVPVSVDGRGRPRLEGPIDFTVSHDSGVLVLALAPPRCGVDVEDSAEEDLREVADRFRGRGEHGGVRALWTAKESVAKAIGTGLCAGLRTIRFDGDPAARWTGVTWRGHRVPLRTRVVDLGDRHLAVTTGWRDTRPTVHTWRPRVDGPRWWLAETGQVTGVLAAASTALITQLTGGGRECGS